MQNPYMDDGYTEDFVLPAGRFWPEVKGTFRPLPAPAWAAFLSRAGEASRNGSLVESTKAQIDVLVSSIKTWDLCTPDKKLVAISEASFGKLRKTFLEALFQATLQPGMTLIDGREAKYEEIMAAVKPLACGIAVDQEDIEAVGKQVRRALFGNEERGADEKN